MYKPALLLTTALVLLLGCGGSSAPTTAAPVPPAGTWALTWSDEFGGVDGSTPAPSKWAYDLGGGGWGNGELETYTSRPANAQITGGNLVITAAREPFTGSDGISRNYTSARLKTQGLFSQKYGRFEARIKIPFGNGIWPAFWLLGDSFGTAGWPTCGEIDIMENIGREPGILHGSAHGPGYSGGAALSQSISLTTGAFADDFHVYAIEWGPGQIDYFLDQTKYASYTPANLPAGAAWVFEQPFFIILNVAVGGAWPGAPDATTVFPQTMLVDYVRVYQH